MVYVRIYLEFSGQVRRYSTTGLQQGPCQSPGAGHADVSSRSSTRGRRGAVTPCRSLTRWSDSPGKPVPGAAEAGHIGTSLGSPPLRQRGPTELPWQLYRAHRSRGQMSVFAEQKHFSRTVCRASRASVKSQCGLCPR